MALRHTFWAEPQQEEEDAAHLAPHNRILVKVTVDLMQVKSACGISSSHRILSFQLVLKAIQ